MIAYIRAYSAGYVVAVFDGDVLIDHTEVTSRSDTFAWIHRNHKDVSKVENIPA